MGEIALPTFPGLVYVDANALIYRIEAIQPYVTIMKPLWDALDTGLQEVTTSELTLLEVLVKPLKLGDVQLQALFTDTLYNMPPFYNYPN